MENCDFTSQIKLSLEKITECKSLIIEHERIILDFKKHNVPIDKSKLIDTFDKCNFSYYSVGEFSKDIREYIYDSIEQKELSILTKYETYPEILDFMNLPENEKISKADLLRSISNYVKHERDSKNPDIIVYITVYDNDKNPSLKEVKREFNLVGKLVPLFNFFRTKMIEKGKINDSDVLLTKLSYFQLCNVLMEPSIFRDF